MNNSPPYLWTDFLLSCFTGLTGLKVSGCVKTSSTLTQGDFSLQVIEYIPSQLNEPQNTVLIIPPTGGVNYIDRSYAKYLCRAGFGVVILKKWTDDDEYNLELSIHTRFYNRAQKAIDMVVEKYSKTSNLGILGTSVGGLHASIALVRRPELKKGFFIVSGGRIAEIIATTTQEVLRDAKIKRKKRYGFKDEVEYMEALKEILPYEPLDMDLDRDQKTIGMVISSDDDVVPTKNQIDLYRDWNPEHVLWSSYGHKFTVIKTWLLDSDKVIRFFKSSH